MKEKLGFAVFFVGLLVMFGVAGGVEHLPAEAGLVDWANLIGIAFTGGCLCQAGVWMIKGDI